MHFLKLDLEGTHYSWREDEKQFFTGQPSCRAFDKFNGNQVLVLINFYGALSERFTLAEGKYIEECIRRDLPVEGNSEISVFNWIRNIVFSLK